MKLVATNGLAPSSGRKASSTVSVLDGLTLLLEDELDKDELELGEELVELDDDEVDEEVLVVVEVDVDCVNKTAAAPAMTIITTITTMIAILLIALRVKAFFRILDEDNGSALCIALFSICYHPREWCSLTQILIQFSQAKNIFRIIHKSDQNFDNYRSYASTLFE